MDSYSNSLGYISFIKNLGDSNSVNPIASGPTGPVGPAGASGSLGLQSVSNYAYFYAVMLLDNGVVSDRGDNVIIIGPTASISFPQAGPKNGNISRSSNFFGDTFILGSIGTYSIQFQVTVTTLTGGQLSLYLNGVEQLYTVVGISSPGQITGMCVITTTTVNSIINISNVSTSYITLATLTGGSRMVYSHLIINQLS